LEQSVSSPSEQIKAGGDAFTYALPALEKSELEEFFG
jgi:hypothetical protein